MNNKTKIGGALLIIICLLGGATALTMQNGREYPDHPTEQPQYTPENTNPPQPTGDLINPPQYEAKITYNDTYYFGVLYSIKWANDGTITIIVNEEIISFHSTKTNFNEWDNLRWQNVQVTITHANQPQPQGQTYVWIDRVTITPIS